MRILLAGMSNMLSSIITAALQQSPDMIIAAVTSGLDDLCDQVRALQAAAVIMQMAEPADFERVRPLLLKFPTLKVIGITGDGESGFLHELHPRTTQLGELSTATLLTALRASPLQPTH